MTDEEMAHAYAIENYEHYKEGQTDYETLKQAVLYGLRAGRPKWNKVADGDLPEVGVPVVGFYYGKDNWHKVYLRADGHWRGDGSLCQPPYVWQGSMPKE